MKNRPNTNGSGSNTVRKSARAKLRHAAVSAHEKEIDDVLRETIYRVFRDVSLEDLALEEQSKATRRPKT